ncbi:MULTISPECIES: nitroreductase family protein [Mycobacterium]|uniref:Nitroreductase domain-containing protein n=1 Tax=Mycobacterium paraseoulense TaxID=590652 RepID=A0A1X0IEY0_9MYCO|nr:MULTISPECIES: nitroreductase family protein [Mycobacterium]MCV7393840.1 nitroreductase family protein [Mycobacterium paraseoulense]OBH11769.1 hypothetical protein A9X04_18390 [Mycobacterium sp. E3247]OBH37715.1 hypothetical protein A5692_09845 [Mycobacterium sp. E342]ORB45431.1 hypothetical protein BST39_04200 [Mycobacterium paraseoulense]BBZ70539.1 putative oxidoreductase [Mycobacterium paraseoulense]
MDFDEVATTTRAVRKRLDLHRAVEPAVLHECLQIALQAPTGTNIQLWRFIVVNDPEKRREIAKYYREGWRSEYESIDSFVDGLPTERQDQQRRVYSSADYLADHLAEVPVLVIACLKGRLQPGAPISQWSGYLGSVIPAIWSLQLALRSRGLGSVFTTVHLKYENEVAALLDIPDNVAQVALLPVAYTKGTFARAKNRSPKKVTSWNSWGNQPPSDFS